MSNLFIAISDVHISLKNLDVSLNVLRQSLDKARELNVPLIIAGDLNDTKAIMRSEWVEALISLFSDFSDVTIYIIDGNHDMNNKASSSSSLFFLDLLNNVFVYHEPSAIAIKNINIGLIPYQNQESDFLEALEHMKKIDIKHIIGHQGVKGSFMGDYVVDDSSVDPVCFEGFDFVGLGHYHKHQKYENYMYFGSPFTVNFGESEQEKFFWQIYEVDGVFHTQPHLTNVRRHRQFTFENEINTEQNIQIKPHDLVKIVLKGTKEFALANHSKTLDKLFVTQNKTIVPEINRQSEIRIDQDIVNKPVEVIESYLENAVTSFDKEELKKHLFKIIQDILNNNSNTINSKVKVLNVRARNFLSYQEIEYNYESKGLTLIEGHDEDHDISTGAGKSTFLDVVCYGLFGETSKNLKADEVINRKNKKDLEVHVELEVDGEKVGVNRYRKHKTYENDLSFEYLGQKEATRGKDNRETQKLLEKELGLDFDMFLRSSYFTQFGSIDKFLSSSDTEKKRIISEICDTKIYDEMVVAVKESIKFHENLYDTNQKEVIAQNSVCSTIDNNIRDLEIKSKSFQETKESNLINLGNSLVDWFTNNKAEADALISSSDSWEENKKRDIDSLNKRSQEFTLDKRSRIIKAENSSEEWIKNEEASVSKLIQNRKEKTLVLEEFSKKIVEPIKVDFSDEKNTFNEKIEIINKLENKKYELQAESNTCQSSIDKYRKEIEKADNKNLESNCLHCFQPISEEHILKHIDELNTLIKKERDKQVSLSGQIEEITSYVNKKKEFEDKLYDIAKKEEEFENSLRQVTEYRVHVDNVKKDIDAIDESIKHRPGNPYTELIASISKEQDPNPASIEAISKRENPFLVQIENKKKEINPWFDKVEIEKNTANSYEELMVSEKAKLTSEQQELRNLNEESGYLGNHIDYSKWWKDALHIYIKSYLTDSFIEQINTLANERLQQMFDGILSINVSSTSESKKTTKEKISVVIYNKNEECSYNSLSGGERCRICFALNLAIAQVTDINFGFLMFDEVLNGLDETGKAQVMKVFKELELKYESVFVIDHTTEFKSLFTNNIMVVKSNGISRIQ